MKSEDAAIARFVQAWIAEFSQAVEMFTGEGMEILPNPTETISIPETESSLWVKQTFADDKGSFITWVGAQKATWGKLGASLGEGSAEALQATYLEIVNQAQQGSSTVTNSALAKTIHCEKPEVFDTPSFESSSFATFELELTAAGLPALLFAIELVAAQVLKADPSATSPQSVAKASSDENSPSSLASLLALKLPVSVSLGHTSLELKQVLQAGMGAVITLNKEVGEPAELLVHGRVVARGEVVLVKGNYGFRISHIVSREDRLEMCKS